MFITHHPLSVVCRMSQVSVSVVPHLSFVACQSVTCNLLPVVHHLSPCYLLIPVVLHLPPVLHLSPVVLHLSPVVLHLSPVVIHLSPVVRWLSPVAHYPSPIVHHQLSFFLLSFCFTMSLLISLFLINIIFT